MLMRKKQTRVFGKSREDCVRKLEDMAKGGEAYTSVGAGFYKTPVFFGLFNRCVHFIVAETKEETE